MEASPTLVPVEQQMTPPEGAQMYDELMQVRREALARSAMHRLSHVVDNAYSLAVGKIAEDNVGFIQRDIPKNEYRRDYKMLSDAGLLYSVAKGGIVTIEGNDEISDDERSQQIRDIYSASPVHQKILTIAQELQSTIFDSYDEEIQKRDELARVGKLELGVRLDPDDPISLSVMDYFEEPGANRLVKFEHTDEGTMKPVIELIDAGKDQEIFISTSSGKALLGAIDKAGLGLTEEAVRELALEEDDRYGNGYAWLTRELAKSINQPERGISFLKDTSGNPAQLEYTGDSATDLVVNLINQIGDRPSLETDIPVTKGKVHMRDGNCKDSEVYFSDSFHPVSGPEKAQMGGKAFIYKTKEHGAETYINSEPVTFNGIELPPGFVFGRMGDNEGYMLGPGRSKDGGFYVMRATAYCLDDPDKALEVFGPGMTEDISADRIEELKQNIARFSKDYKTTH